jgi:hypothetical protein
MKYARAQGAILFGVRRARIGDGDEVWFDARVGNFQ